MKNRSLPRRFARFLRDEGGAIAVMGALLAVVGIGALAVSVDAITLYFQRRQAQGAVDLAAIAAARDIDRAEAAAAATIADNRVPSVQTIIITRGHYAANAAIPAAARFVANGTPVNAVRVDLTNRAPLYFGRSIAKQAALDVVTRATAVNTAEAAFSIGSRLLSLNGGVLNAVLGATLGGRLTLTAMDYNNLAAFNVDLFQFSNVLATKAGGTIGTYQELATANVSAANVLDALTTIAQAAPGGAAAQFSLNALKAQSDAKNVSIPAGRLIDFGPSGYLGIGQGGSAFAAKASALSIINAVAGVANGKHQIEATANLAIPGLAALELGVTVGERPQASPWVALGDEGATVYTAQTRLRLTATIGGGGLLLGSTIRLPIYLDVAGGRATLSSVSCGTNPMTDTRVTLAVTPSVIDAWIGQPSSEWTALTLPPTMQPATLVAIPLLGVSANGQAEVQISNTGATDVSFGWNDIANLTAKTVRTTDFTTSLVSGLVDKLALSAKAGPLSLTTPALVTAAVKTALAPVTPALDTVLSSVLTSLGIGLGEADVWVNGVRCDGAALVN